MATTCVLAVLFLGILRMSLAATCCLSSSNCSSLEGGGSVVVFSDNDNNTCSISVDAVQNSSFCVRQCLNASDDVGGSSATSSEKESDETWIKVLLIIVVVVYGLLLVLLIAAVIFLLKPHWQEHCDDMKGKLFRQRTTTASNEAYGIVERLRAKRRGGSVKGEEDEESFYANPELYNTVQPAGTETNPNLSTSPTGQRGAKVNESKTDEYEYSYTNMRFPDDNTKQDDSKSSPSDIKNKGAILPTVPSPNKEGKQILQLKPNMAYNPVTVGENEVESEANGEKSPTVVLVLNTQQPSSPNTSPSVQLVRQLPNTSPSSSPAPFQLVPTQQSEGSTLFKLVQEEGQEKEIAKRVSTLAMGFENLIIEKDGVKKSDP